MTSGLTFLLVFRCCIFFWMYKKNIQRSLTLPAFSSSAHMIFPVFVSFGNFQLTDFWSDFWRVTSVDFRTFKTELILNDLKWIWQWPFVLRLVFDRVQEIWHFYSSGGGQKCWGWFLTQNFILNPKIHFLLTRSSASGRKLRFLFCGRVSFQANFCVLIF